MAMNPAGFTKLAAPRLDLSVASIFARGTFVNSANPAGQLNSNGAIPYGAFGTPLGKSRFRLGLAVLPELASTAKWRYVDTPGGRGGVSYGSLHNESDILAMRGAIALGMYLGARVQIGIMLGAVYNTNTLQTAYVFQNQTRRWPV